MPTKNFDVFETTNPGILFGAGPQTWMIAPTIIVSSSSNNGVESGNLNSSLINHGHILSTSVAGAGVYFHGFHGAINNAIDGDIFGTGYGVALAGSAYTVTNLGSIIGRDFYGV